MVIRVTLRTYPVNHRGLFRGETVCYEALVVFRVQLGRAQSSRLVVLDLLSMKEKTKTEPQDSSSSEPVYTYYPLAGVTENAVIRLVEPDPEALYRCKHCGKRMTLRETTNFYGIPACPVCVNAGAPFEIVRDGN